MSDPQSVVLYRMVLPEHTCPFGLRAKSLLEQRGIDFEDRILASRDEVEEFKQQHGVATTPLVFIDGEPIGGSDDLARHLEQSAEA